MNSFGAVIMMLFISSHTYIKLQFYSMHKMIKSGGMTNPFALYTATIMKCKEEASTWFDQMFWDTWTDITFFDLIFCKNTVSSILNPWSGVMFLSMMWFFAFHRNIRSPSSVASSRTLFTISEVLRQSLGWLFIIFNPATTQEYYITCMDVNLLIDLVALDDNNFPTDRLPLRLHPNHPCLKICLYFFG